MSADVLADFFVWCPALLYLILPLADVQNGSMLRVILQDIFQGLLWFSTVFQGLGLRFSRLPTL